MQVAATFLERIQTIQDPYRLYEELETIRRIVIEERRPKMRDELCFEQRLIQERLYQLEYQRCC